MSTVINWLKETRGPDAVVVFVEWYDYSISDVVFALPKQKNDVVVAIKNVFSEMDVSNAEDIAIDLKIRPQTNEPPSQTNYLQWKYDDFINKGKDAIEGAILDQINKSWDVEWTISGWYNDGNDTWEFNFRRHNFV